MSTYLIVGLFTMPAWATMLWAIILEINNYRNS